MQNEINCKWQPGYANGQGGNLGDTNLLKIGKSGILKSKQITFFNKY